MTNFLSLFPLLHARELFLFLGFFVLYYSYNSYVRETFLVGLSTELHTFEGRFLYPISEIFQLQFPKLEYAAQFCTEQMYILLERR